MPRRIAPFVVVAVAFAATALGGCEDPCVALARRICNCEATFAARQACVADRITNQQGSVELTDADRAVCSDKLDTCTCAALDQNDLDACGFVPTGDAQ
jgi:hypothetical protein